MEPTTWPLADVVGIGGENEDPKCNAKNLNTKAAVISICSDPRSSNSTCQLILLPLRTTASEHGWSADVGDITCANSSLQHSQKKGDSAGGLFTMASTKVTTVIVNRTGEALVLKVGNQNCFAKLAAVEVGGEHKVEIDVNWTYREFSLQPVKAGSLKRVVVSSDDCCDFERMIVSESGGKFHVEKIGRRHFNTSVPVITDWRALFWSKIKQGFWQ